MAEELDDSVIIIDEDQDLYDLDEEFETEDTSHAEAKKEKRFAKWLFWLKAKRQQVFFGASLALLILFFGVLFSTFAPEEPELIPLDEKQHEVVKKLSEGERLKKYIKKSDLEKMLSKANILYESGQKEKALDIYHQISLYNESISFYNLGVARMKEGDYANAYDAFKTALQNRQNRTASALNAAICAKEMGLDANFAYYIDLAEASLNEEVLSPLYSYYYALINYYKHRPIRALAAIKAPTSDFFIENQNILATDLYLDLDDFTGSLNAISKNKDPNDALTMGLLHANIGEYRLAIDHLKRAVENNTSADQAKEALLLAYLKNSDFSMAASTIGTMPQKYPWDRYPIEVFLKERLFDIDLAQDYFSNKIFLDKQKLYSIIFYFSPYEIFDPKRSFTALKKGQVNLDVGEIKLAKEFINTSRLLSNTNANISIAIKLALNSHTAKANKIFARLNEKFENHDTLEYNLGLSLAQLGDYTNAYEHFRRAHFLNGENILAGLFALFCADLSGKETEQIEKRLKTEITAQEESVEKLFYQTLLNLYRDNLNAMLQWIEIEKAPDPLYLLTEALVADRVNRQSMAVQSSQELLKKFPDDIVANILHLYVSNKETNVKKYAFRAQQFMARKNLDFDPLFYGPDIVRELYLFLAQISGNLPKVKHFLEEKLSTEQYDRQGMLQALGKTNIYLKNFEEAFVQYNQLIDELKVTDTQTLLDAAIAAVGAGHKENAIVLLEVAKITDKRNFEARYGLGLLNQEIKNYKAASMEYQNINDRKYESRYFDFRIKEER